MELDMYEDYEIKEPRLGKDGRLRVFLRNRVTGESKGMSYPRLVMEMHLGHSILPENDVHHIDGNPLNNEISNLEIVNHRIHCAEHSRKYHEAMEVTCYWCGNDFELTPKQQSAKHRERNRRPGSRDKYFCSRSCSGKYGTEIQRQMK
jgi:hypothetical protein